MNLDDIKAFYFIGIGGMGMSSLASYLNYIGKKVSGYDRSRSFLTHKLEQEGISIIYHDNIDLLPSWIYSEQCLIVYTPAITKNNNKQWIFLQKNGKKNIQKRSQLLSLITKNKICIAIGGTHGKTTTGVLLGHILKITGKNITAFLGGISENYQSNLILNGNDMFLVEADEFDHSFLHLNPNIACITSLDQDHVDTYPKKDNLVQAYIKFSQRIRHPYKTIFLCKEESYYSLSKTITTNIIYYSILKKEKGIYYSNHIYIKENKWYFDFHTPKETWKNLTLPLPGYHNLKNITAALAISDYLKLKENEVRKALWLFKGIHRRYSIHFQSKEKIYIDDYAHHPTEINALINTIRKCFINKQILGVFQPHLFSRTKFFEEDFARSLEKLDILILLDIYPARELPLYGVNSYKLLDKIKMKNKEVSNMSNLLNQIEKKQFDILLTIGAGSIDSLVYTIKNWFHKRYG
ncbi:UDP-N-acetylmuramate--L-alanine ligase [Blattabacterium cuenoti]|uniref:UDP-N-acetylmuramate--L-alanine ligase n=1 Tax=Blattabacterium cuenoti TaxID=1653831 RepID=UPI00163C0D27|nr:UDP-N-acetylmuramate--L-alanine ligase [Blattabacterium cuenoti]